MSEEHTGEMAGADEMAGGQPLGEQTVLMEQPQVPAPPAEAAPGPDSTGGTKKKRKIDLKSRLSNVRAAGSIASMPGGRDSGGSDPLAFPPPPVGNVPPPQVLRQSSGGFLPASSPFAPPEPEVKPTAQQQTIKVEVGEEIFAERKKASKKTLVYALLSGAVMLALGVVLGGARERGQAGHKAIAGAKALSADVKKANDVMKDMKQQLLDAREKLAGDEYPEQLGAYLAKTNVDFTPQNFQGKSVGGLPGDVLRYLLEYAQGVDELNKKKDALRNLIGYSKEEITKYIAEKKEPVVSFSVVFEKQGDNIVAQLLPHKSPFSEKAKWPDKYPVIKPSGKKTEDVEVTRWDGKEKLLDGKQAVPIERKYSAGLISRQKLGLLMSAFADTAALIQGIDSPIPSQQKDGLVKIGERLQEGLGKVAAAR